MKKQLIFNAAWVLLFGLTAISCNRKAPQQSQMNDYKVMTVSLSDTELSMTYSASVRGRQDIEIRPQVSGLITEVRVKEGETVRKGQILFVIDQVTYKAALETAVANVEVAKANVATAQMTADSKQELFDQEVVSSFDLQTAQNSLKSAQASLAQAKAQEINARNNLSFTEIKSPSDGVVGILPYKVGALVSSGITSPLTTVSDNSEMYVYFSMTEKQVLALTRQNGSLNNVIAAMPAIMLQLIDGSLYSEKGCIEAVSGVIDQSTGAVSVRAAFSNADRILISGSTGKVIFPQTFTDRIVIPQAATYETQDKIFVYKVADGITHATEVKVNPSNDGKTYIVESGLNAGDIIVAEGVAILRNGTPINAIQ